MKQNSIDQIWMHVQYFVILSVASQLPLFRSDVNIWETLNVVDGRIYKKRFERFRLILDPAHLGHGNFSHYL